MTADTMSVPTARAARPRGVHVPRPVHTDREPAPAWMRATGAVLFVAGAALTAAVLGWPGEAPESALVLPGVLGVVVGLLLLLARSGCTVTADHVVLHFRPLPPRRIPRRRIADVRLVEADAATYGGVGLRFRRGVRALILTPGPGIEFTDDRGRRTFVRSRRPEGVLRALAGPQGRSGGTAGVARGRLG